MVQKNIYYLNKSGHSMFWNSMWCNKTNYSKCLQKTFFSKNFLSFFFNDFFTDQFILKYKPNNLKFIRLESFNLNKKNNKNIHNFLKKKNEKNFYTSKIWFFKFQNWIILYIYVFYKNFIKIKNKSNKKHLFYYNYINKYLFFLSKNVRLNNLKNNF